MVGLRLISIVVAIIAALLCIADIYLLPTLYVFDPVKLQQISKKAIASPGAGKNFTLLLDHLVTGLQEEYGTNLVQSLAHNEWFLNNAGGAMGQMVILHASLTEYLIVFGSPVGTEGHTGVHLADDYFTILRGQQWASYTGELERRIYKAGDQHHLPKNTAGQYRLLEDSWALELAQGWIPSMLVFGMMDIISSTADVYTMYRTVTLTGRHMLISALHGKI
jgi:C-8 sterol isomerase